MNIQKVNVSGEAAVRFTAFYPFIWIKNIGANDAYAANFSGFDAGDNDVACIPAGEAVRLDAMSNEIFIKSTGTTVYAHAQNVVESPFLDNFVAGGEEITVESLSVTQNGTYTAPTGTAYSPVTVDVQEQPWAPLEDGYSNFWFELTDDTLSPWLNFSAKNNDAVIDWGDGSGEQPLDTLTPTHTYAKAGRYVVKVKGVTGIAQQHITPYNGYYLQCLKNVELASETVAGTLAFNRCVGIKNISYNADTLSQQAFQNCTSLLTLTLVSGVANLPTSLCSGCYALSAVTIPNTVTTIDSSAFNNCSSLGRVTIPATITVIGASAFSGNYSLTEIHILATTPPTLGASALYGLPSDFIIYVPVGTGDTYKAAAGWSAYSDHILEEGEVVTRAMQSKFKKEAEKSDNGEIEMR